MIEEKRSRFRGGGKHCLDIDRTELKPGVPTEEDYEGDPEAAVTRDFLALPLSAEIGIRSQTEMTHIRAVGGQTDTLTILVDRNVKISEEEIENDGNVTAALYDTRKGMCNRRLITAAIGKDRLNDDFDGPRLKHYFESGLVSGRLLKVSIETGKENHKSSNPGTLNWSHDEHVIYVTEDKKQLATSPNMYDTAAEDFGRE